MRPRKIGTGLGAVVIAIALGISGNLLSTSYETSDYDESSYSYYVEDAENESAAGDGSAAAGSSGAAQGSASQGAGGGTSGTAGASGTGSITREDFGLDDVPAYSGSPCIDINGGMPFFTDEEKQSTEAFETYSALDSLGRCGVAYANVCEEIMPTEKRGSIGQVKPTGWHTVRYDDLVEGKYLYNRCHLIAYQLAGENANEKNLITGTRYMNAVSMLKYENIVADYVDDTHNHVLYRVSPWFDGDDLVASGVEMEAWSVEDAGAGVCYHVYCYNIQPGITIDYATGNSYRAG